MSWKSPSISFLLIVAATACAGCKPRNVSNGTCSGAVGQLQVSGALSEQSAFELAWHDAAAPTLMRLDCGGKLVLFAELKRTAQQKRLSFQIPSDDPSCFGKADAGQTHAVAPICSSENRIGWQLDAPKVRPPLATGSVEATLDEKANILRGTAKLVFEDGTRSTIDFALAYGHVENEFPHGVEVSGVPGRIDFSGQ